MAQSTATANEAHGHAGPKHDYNLVDPSPWPFAAAWAAFAMVLGGAMWLNEVPFGGLVFLAGVLATVTVAVLWWRDVLSESKRGDYSDTVASMLRVGMVLFIVSEVLFFFGFFWAFFWGALVPPDLVEAQWPPAGVEPVHAFGIPFMNTLILLLSGTTVTWAHHAIREGDNQTAFKAIALTVALGMLFTAIQVYEYVEIYHHGLTMQSGVFGSTFYMATGFHGFHVMVGTIFLAVCAARAAKNRFSPKRHVGFEAASWYWHFVDVVWLFLFVAVYWWGQSLKWTSTGVGG